MTEQAFPLDEARLRTLQEYRILDTPPEAGFDDVVTLATQLCNTPVALVSLVDRDRQWFKARQGFEPTQTDLDSSVCRHALGQADILEIADLTRDPRTAANPLVTGEPFIRFYAGAPLRTAEGQTLGTLCVIDKAPRPGGLTEPQRTALRALANQVMAQLDLRRAVERREADRQVALAEAARLEALIATQQAVASAAADLSVVFQAITDGALRVVDAADGTVVELRDGGDLVYDTVSGTSAQYKGVRLPMGETLSGEAVRTERPLYCPDTLIDPTMDHSRAVGLGIRSMIVVPVTRRGEPIGALKVQSGRPDAFAPRDVVMTQMLAGLVASAFGDVAEVRTRRALKQAETRYRQTFESVTEFGVVVTDKAGVITEWNTGAERIFGWSADEICGQDAERFFTPEDRAIDRVGFEMSTSLREGSAVDERWHLRKDGSRFYASGNMMPLMGDDGEHLGFIKIVRDRTDQHLDGLRLRELERQLLHAQAVGGVGPFTVDIVANRLEGTPEFSRIFGMEHQATRDPRDFEALILPEDQHLVSHAASRRSGEASVDVEYRIRRADTGEVRWILRKAEVELDEGGKPARFTGLVRDITARKAAEQALLDSEAKWRGLFENLQEGFLLGRVIRDEIGRVVDWRYEEVNRAWGDLIGIDPASVIGRTVREAIPDVEDEWINEFAGVVETGLAIRFTRRVGTLDRWYDGVAQPAGADRFTVIFMEVTDRVRSELRRSALLQLGDHLRDAVDIAASTRASSEIIGEIFEASRVCFGVVDPDRETVTIDVDWCAPDVASIEGKHSFRTFGSYVEDLTRGATVVVRDVRTDPRTKGRGAEALEALGIRSLVNLPIMERGRMVGIAIVHFAGLRDWTDEDTAFLRDAAGRTQLSVARHQAEARQMVLNRELSHRMKNTIAVMSSIVGQTLRVSPDVATARKTLADRIQALSRAHDIILAGQRDAGMVRAIVSAATSLHDAGERIRLAGPDVLIGEKAALSLSLVIHELATNAGKYGALSVDDGHVDIRWDLNNDEPSGEPQLSIEWCEVGGPPVVAPTRRSFGTRLIEMGLSGSATGTSQIEYAAGGLRCRLTAPLGELQADDTA